MVWKFIIFVKRISFFYTIISETIPRKEDKITGLDYKLLVFFVLISVLYLVKSKCLWRIIRSGNTR